MNLRFGTAGWSYPDWEGIVYPKPRPGGFDELQFLAGIFSSLEINSTFYRIPSVRTSESWVRRISFRPDFRFTAKLWSRFTHEAGPFEAEDVRLFRQGLQPLKESGRLGALLLQFPWSFRKNKEAGARLLRLFEAFQDYPLVLEVRHSSWNDAAVYDFLKRYQVGFCNIDQPVIGDSLQPTSQVTSPIGYFRLHGRNYKAWFQKDAGRDQRYDYLYTAAEIESLVPLVREISEQAVETYVIANNHYKGQAPCNILEFQQLLTGECPPIPEQLLDRYPELSPGHKDPLSEL